THAYERTKRFSQNEGSNATAWQEWMARNGALPFAGTRLAADVVGVRCGYHYPARPVFQADRPAGRAARHEPGPSPRRPRHAGNDRRGRRWPRLLLYFERRLAEIVLSADG